MCRKGGGPVVRVEDRGRCPAAAEELAPSTRDLPQNHHDDKEMGAFHKEIRVLISCIVETPSLNLLVCRYISWAERVDGSHLKALE